MLKIRFTCSPIDSGIAVIRKTHWKIFYKQMPTKRPTIMKFCSILKIITTRKRSLRRLCFHRPVSVCPQGGVCHTSPWSDTPWTDTPWSDTPVLGRHPSWADTPVLGRHPSSADTPLGQTPPWADTTPPLAVRSTSGRYASY